MDELKLKPIRELHKSDVIKFTEELFKQIKIDYNIPNWSEEFLLSFSSLVMRDNSKLSFCAYSFSDLDIAFKMNAYGGLDKHLGRQSSVISSFKMQSLIKILWAYKSYSSQGSITSTKIETKALNKDEIRNQYIKNLVEYYELWLQGEDPPIRTPFYTAGFLKSLNLIDEDVTYHKNELANIFIKSNKPKINDYNTRLVFKAFNNIRESGHHINHYINTSPELPF